MSLNFCILSSGSSGNCSVIWTDKTAILVDLGCSSKYLIENLDILGISPQKLEAVMITHAHMDHISASGFNFIAKNNIPICTHEDALKDISKKYSDKIEKCASMMFSKNLEFKDLAIESFDVHHKDRNISKTLEFAFFHSLNKRQYKIGYVTDTGKVSKKIDTKTSIFIEPFIRYWDIAASDIVNGFLEPKNNTVEYGAKIGLSF